MTATIDRTDLDRTRFLIDNEWVEPLGSETHHALEAATGESLGTAALGTDADIDAAVKAARRALDHGPWGRTTAAERAEYMHRFAAALTARAEATSQLVSQENGMPIGLSSAFNGAAPAGLLQMYAEIVKTMDLEEVRASASGSTIVRREPVGVVGAIAPWNYPQVLAMMKIAPALAAGCTIVLKPSPETALDSYVMGDAAKERPGCPRASSTSCWPTVAPAPRWSVTRSSTRSRSPAPPRPAGSSARSAVGSSAG